MTTTMITYEIPDGGTNGVKGGTLYDVWGNFDQFADVTGLETSSQDNVEKSVSIGAHKRERFMRDPAPANISAKTLKYVRGIQRSKGGLPGYSITLQATINDKVETRQFTFDGAQTGLYLFMQEKCKQDTLMWGKTGNPYEPIIKKS